MKKAVNECCFPNQWSLEKKISITSTLGLDGIEFNVNEYNDDSGSLYLGITDGELKRIVQLTKLKGLDIVSISTGLLWNYPLTDNDTVIREKGKQIVKDMIRIARILQAKVILIVPGLVTDTVPYEVAYERSYQALTELKTSAEDSGIIIAIENVWNKFLLSPIEFKHFIDKLNSQFIRVYFDAGNVLLYGYPEQWVSYLGEYIVRVHVKDFDRSAGNVSGFCALLKGNLNFKAFKDALIGQKYAGYLTVEIPYDEQEEYNQLNEMKVALDKICEM